jgi:hypothetical protein
MSKYNNPNIKQLKSLEFGIYLIFGACYLEFAEHGEVV